MKIKSSFEISNFSFSERLDFGRVSVVPKDGVDDLIMKMNEKSNKSSGYYECSENKLSHSGFSLEATHEVIIKYFHKGSVEEDKQFICWLLSFFNRRLVLNYDRVYLNPTKVDNLPLIFLNRKEYWEKVLSHFLEQYDLSYDKAVFSKFGQCYDKQSILRAILYQDARQYDRWYHDWIYAVIAFMEYDNLKMVLYNDVGDVKQKIYKGKKLFEKYIISKPDKTDRFRELRNEIFHTGCFYGIPFDLSGNTRSDNIMYETNHLQNLNQRLVCLAFQYRNKFAETKWNNRDNHEFDILKSSHKSVRK